jgi:hypothetical protein
MLQQIYRLRPDSVGDKNGGIHANHSTKQATMQHQYYFKIVKECDDQFCKREENKAINSKKIMSKMNIYIYG